MNANIAPRGLLAAALLGAFGAASAQTPAAPHCASIQSKKPEVCIPDWTTRAPSNTGTAVIPGAATSDATNVVPPASSSRSTTGIVSGATVSSDANTTLDVSPSVNAPSTTSPRMGGFFKPSETSSLNGTTSTTPR